ENRHLPLTAVREYDRKTFELRQKAKTNGALQLESSEMKQDIIRFKPTQLDDIVAVNDLYRLGPNDYLPHYINRKQRRETVTKQNPDLEHILEKTYGVLIYQEQIMQIAHDIAGFSLGQADLLRRGVSKKQHRRMDKQKEAFIKGCLEKGY